MVNPKVYIADGHGLRPDGTIDPGATAGSETEQNSVSVVRAAMVDYLRPYPVSLMDERTTDPNYQGSPERANDWGADYFIAIHRDWVKGLQGIFGFWVSDSGMALADDLYAACKRAGLRMEPTWHQYRDNLRVLNATAMPATLFEIGRVGGTDFDDQGEREAVGRALAEGLLNHLGIPVNSTIKPATGSVMFQIGLKQGDKNEAVKAVQRALVTLHATEGVKALPKYGPDGDWGDELSDWLGHTIHSTSTKPGDRPVRSLSAWSGELLMRVYVQRLGGGVTPAQAAQIAERAAKAVAGGVDEKAVTEMVKAMLDDLIITVA